MLRKLLFHISLIICTSSFAQQIAIKIDYDTLGISNDKLLYIPLTITPLTEHNFFFYERNQNSKHVCLNNHGPLRITFLNENKRGSTKGPLWKIGYFLRYGHKPSTRINRVKVRSPSKKICSEVLSQEETKFLLEVELSRNQIKQIKSGHNLKLQISYDLFYYKERLVFGIVSNAPYMIVAEVNRIGLDKNRIITGSQKSNILIIKSQ